MDVQFFTTDGRLRRTGYFLLSIAVSAGTAMLFLASFMLTLFMPLIGIPAFLVSLIVMGWIQWNLTVQRCHDFGMNWKIAALGYLIAVIASVPETINQLNEKMGSPTNTTFVVVSGLLELVSGLVFLYILFAPPSKGENDYGYNPRD